MRSARLFASALTAATLLTVTACGGGSGSSGSDSSAAGGADAPKIAAVFSGTTTDADYTFLGLQALKSAEKEFGAQTTYSESVAVPDAERVLREYVADGNTVVWTHGSQFYDATVKVAKESPDVVFIAEQDTQPADVPDNVWVLDRNFQLAFYPLGVLAGATTKSGKIAYLGGATLPFSYSEVHAVQQALKDSGSERHAQPGVDRRLQRPHEVAAVRQPAHRRRQRRRPRLAQPRHGRRLRGRQERGRRLVLMTAKYTDKSDLAPDNYLTSVIYDFSVMLDEILTKVQDGDDRRLPGHGLRQGHLPAGAGQRRQGRGRRRSTRPSRT